MDILLIISQFSPAQTPNTLRWLPLVKHLTSIGHSVSILTTKRRGVPEESTIGNIKIYRAGHNTLLDRLYDLFDSKLRRNEEGYSSGGGTGLATGMLQGIANKYWRNNYWPDGSMLFLKPGIKRGQTVIEKDKIDKVISVGLPFTAHWIAKHLKEKNPRLHWVMDIQDPFCYSDEFRVNNFEKYQNRNIEAERETFQLVDKVSITNQHAKDKYEEYFPKYVNKVKVIPPLYSDSNSNLIYNMQLSKDKIHVGFFGSFYEGVRSPKKFLDFIKYIYVQDKSLLDNYQFHFIGQMDRGTNELLDNYSEIRRCLVLHGFKNRDRTVSAMKQVDFLLNFGNTTDYHLPSKVVDYLYINKPIINISSVTSDSTALFFSNKEIPILNLKIEQSLYSIQIEQFFKFLELDHVINEEPHIEPFALPAIANAYLALLDSNAMA